MAGVLPYKLEVSCSTFSGSRGGVSEALLIWVLTLPSFGVLQVVEACQTYKQKVPKMLFVGDRPTFSF